MRADLLSPHSPSDSLSKINQSEVWHVTDLRDGELAGNTHNKASSLPPTAGKTADGPKLYLFGPRLAGKISLELVAHQYW